MVWNWSEILDVFLDVLKDSAITIAVVFAFNVLVSFIENKLSKTIGVENKWSPLIGAGIGLIPQCGFSVIASDMYLKRKITMGTLVAVFIACSDEALPIMVMNPDKLIMIIPLLLVKLVIGFLIGFSLDTLFSSQIKKMQDKSLDNIKIASIKTQKISFSSQVKPDTCCAVNAVDFKKESDTKKAIKKHLLNPLKHSAKIFAYVFVINFIFSYLVYFIGEDNITNFLNANQYISPLLSVIVGLIPNCASSIIITTLYVKDGISFGAAIGGLICNAGVGLVYLLKDKKKWRETLTIILTVVGTGLVVGYICLLIHLLTGLAI